MALKLLQINTSRDDIYCPGDTVSYNCSIISSTEMPHLNWKVTFPGLMPISFTYNSSSSLYKIDNLDMNISVTLTDFTTTNQTEYVNEIYMESILTLTVLRNITMNNTKLECSIADLHSITVTVYINTSGWYVCRADYYSRNIARY